MGVLTWLRHVQDAELASRDLPRVFTSYDALLPGWQPLADRVARTFNFTWPVAPRTAQERIAELVNPDLRHHSASIDDFLSDPLVPKVFQETLRVLERWSKDSEDAEGRDVLDQLRCDFDQAAPLLYAPVTALEVAKRDARALEPHKAAAEAHAAEFEAMTARLAKADSQRDQVELQLDLMREDLVQFRQAEDAAQAETIVLSAELAEGDLREIQLSVEIETLAGQIIERDNEVFSLQRELD